MPPPLSSDENQLQILFNSSLKNFTKDGKNSSDERSFRFFLKNYRLDMNR